MLALVGTNIHPLCEGRDHVSLLTLHTQCSTHCVACGRYSTKQLLNELTLIKLNKWEGKYVKDEEFNKRLCSVQPRVP